MKGPQPPVVIDCGNFTGEDVCILSFNCTEILTQMVTRFFA